MAIQNDESRWQHTLATAVWSGLVVVASPSVNALAGLPQRFEPDLAQAFVSEGSIEAVDVGVVRRAARLNQDVLNAVVLCP